MTENKTKRYIDILQDAVASYNNTVHRTIGLRPAEVTNEHGDAIRQRINPQIADESLVYKFKVGDFVRVAIERAQFHRGFTANQFTDEIYIINKRLKTDPPTYKLRANTDVSQPVEDIAESYYEAQLIAAG